ncbi:PREDICTED: SH3 domain-containing RING finger protein 3 [Elephantulus edwardii]|uniref:SH3 domain-containing RING finger protein 3 n=1 Tax=Elephantulus edwardii TaxID=28737 RepID=UPI0003F07127|nr:PREDICTED: SH3 domain-containing RING finger protein 3 [Elephantulus edwardii]
MLLGASWLCASKAAAAAAQSEGDDERPGERRRRRAAATATVTAAAGEEMDESSLLDLLECSVCLERLDTTAKVLPCQHTFCRRCLESIVCSRHELRCPECRILVGCGVDELPANILLVRLLDGIRQRPRAGGSGAGSGSGSSSNGGSPTARPYPGAAPALGGGGGGAAGSAPGSPVFLPAAAAAAAGTSGAAGSATSSLRELAAAGRSAPLAKNISQLPYGKALYNYEGKEPGDLKFNKGDIIILRRKVDENWYHGELNGNHGFLPASYIQCLRPLPQAPPQGKALYDFEIKDKDQDKDCLTFTKDEILTVIRRVDDNWAEGMLGDKIGIFPLLYVELNDSAKQLIEMDKTCFAAASGCDASLPSEPSAAATLAPASTLSSTGAVSAFQRRIDGKKNAKKRHSFTALSVTHKSSQAVSNRHSMEISAPVLISSSDPRAAARIGELAHLSSSAPTQDSSSSSSAGSATMAVPRACAAAGEQGTSPKVQLPLNVYLALYAYKPQKNDELELRKGEMYRVIEKCQDGWFKGTSLRTGVSGVFPGNYVTPVSRVPVGGAGPTRNNVVGGSPLAKGMTTTIQPGGGSLSSPATATRPAVPLTTPQAHAQHQAASPPMGTCLRHSPQPATSQARSPIPTAAHSSAQAQDRPTATVSPLRTQSSPSRLPAASLRPHSVVSPQHIHQPPIQMVVGAQCPRPVIPLTSAASAITPPNVSAANLNGEVGGGPIGCLLTSSPPNTGCKPDEKKNEKKEKKSGLLKLLAGASTKKKSRSPPSISPTHDPHVAVDASLQGAVGPDVCSLSSHGRAGSCPIESEMQGAMGMEPLHRKTGSLDLNFSLSPSRQVPLSMAAIRPEPKPLPRERYRVVVSYPPQSEAEIELKEGDIVFVHKKREDGWYKGTLQRNGRTGLFPGSFVESF